MARTPGKNKDIIDEYLKNPEVKIDKTAEKPTGKNISTAKDSSAKIK
ncbi:hypothetical protein M0P65_03980 [Candidatus Gracilibacteria bacterium]|nr:hypothetical protein [Candidatus Gracilibacteria bacterium]